MKEYIKLLRVKHYIKNILVFVPLFFSGNFFNIEKLISASMGFVCFCLLSSSIYILNDYKDIEIDRNHPTKRNRPLASGRIKASVGLVIMIICLAVSIIVSLCMDNKNAGLCLVLYYILNVAYSMGLKNMPIIDVVILASGFVIRTFYGGFITETVISQWLYLVIIAGSLYMGLCKRRNELQKQTESRPVLQLYNYSFLDKNMYVCIALSNVFYALWTMDVMGGKLIWTVPVFTIMLMCYSLDAEGDSDGDPVDTILQDKRLIVIIILFAICLFFSIYG